MFEIERRRDPEWLARKLRIAAPQRRQQRIVERERRAHVAAVVRVVVALLLLRVHAVRERRVQDGLGPVDAAHEAAAAHEDDRMASHLLVLATPAAPMRADDVRDFQPIAA